MRRAITIFSFFLILGISRADFWKKVDSLDFSVKVPPGSEAVVSLFPEGDSLSLVVPPDGLTDHAREAIQCAPEWLRQALTINLSRLPSSYQNELADILLIASYPYGDEVAFQIAHLPKDVITDPNFDTQVIIDNVLFIYSIDSSLDYVTLVDSGNPGCGGDYYSTLVYKVLEDGDTVELSLPRDIYYWYVVFPKCQEEFPGYIDPNTGYPASPPQGVFWRDYLFNHADTGYPLLGDFMSSVKTLWNTRQDSLEENGAVGRLALWVDSVMTWGNPPYPRLPQPVYVYHHHHGTCSEYGWLTTGAARTVLIPITMTVAFRNNHKWNEFWERGWHQFEPVMHWIDHPGYDPGWWELLANFDWRGDGYIETATERYTANCTLTVYVEDLNGHPVDGATVKIDGPGWPGPWCTLGFTKSDGSVEFCLGDNISYFTAQVYSDLGNIGPTTVINNSQAGAHYNWVAALNATVDTLSIEEDTMPQNPLDLYKVEVHVNSPHEVVYAQNLYSENQFYKLMEPGCVDFFISDSSNFSLYQSGDPFRAFLINKNSSAIDTEFTFPWDGRWYVVFSNKECISDAQLLSATVFLYKKTTTLVEESKEARSRPLSLSIEGGNIKRGRIVFHVFTPTQGFATIDIYSPSGQLVKRILGKNIKKGIHRVVWDGRDQWGREIPQGLYLVRFTLGDFSEAEKLILVK